MSEQFYDQEIAPRLLEIGRMCQEHNVPFVACVEYEPGNLGHIATLANATFASTLVDLAARANGNVDNLVLAVARHARHHGHSSVTLTLLEDRENDSCST